MDTIRQGRHWAARGRLRPVLLSLGAIVAALAGAPFREARASDTRTLTFFHTHTSETATITFRRNGAYDESALKQLNWLLRDWRVDEPADMDPRLFDVLWEVYREVGSREAIHVISAYRSPKTNNMLRQVSGGVAENSQHMAGKAMDIRLPDVDTARLRAAAMRLQYGGVGFYPSSKFVHVDTGSVRAWPRMSQDQLARLFPDGKTIHLPANGKPLSGYEEARAEILPRNAALAGSTSGGGSGGSLVSAFAALFKGGDQPAPAPQPQATASLAVQDAPAATPAAAVPLPPRRPNDAPVTLAAVSPAGETPRRVAAEDLLAAVHDERVAARVLFSHAALHTGSWQEARITLAQVRVAPVPGGSAMDFGPSRGATVLKAVRPETEIARFTGAAVTPPRQLADADL